MRSTIIFTVILFYFYSFTKIKAETEEKQENLTLNTIDKQIRPHFVEFLQYCSISPYAEKCKKNLKLLSSVKFKKMPDPFNENVVGVCDIYDTFREVKLKNNAFPVESLEFKLLVWHELGHCLMDRPHVKEKAHIMNQEIVDNKTITTQWTNLVRHFLYDPPEWHK